MGLVERLLPVLAAWGVWIFAGFLLLAVLGTFWVGRGRRFLVPAGWRGRLVSGLFLCLALVSGLLLYAVTGPLNRVLSQVREMRSVVNRPAAELAYRAVSDDVPHRLSELRGKVVVLNLWATWCPPCRRELPDMDRLQKTYAGKGLVVVTLSNEERTQLLEFAATHPSSTLNVYTSDLGWLEVDGRPLSLVIDREGVVRSCFIGARSYAEFEREIGKWLGGDGRSLSA